MPISGYNLDGGRGEPMGRVGLALAALAVCFLSAARAADLPAAPPAPPPPPAAMAPPIWTGLYIGIDGGWAGGTGDQIAGVGSVTFINPFSTGGGMPGTVAGITTEGELVGGHIGYNYQVSNLVVGLEASAAWASISGTATMGLTFPNGAVSTATWSTKVNWQATATPRVGFAYGNWLAYAKGGLAAAGDHVWLLTSQAVAPSPQRNSASVTRSAPDLSGPRTEPGSSVLNTTISTLAATRTMPASA